MELLVFGHGGLPVLVFPTSGGRFFEFEDRGMIAALSGKIDAGQLQVYCVDSVDKESWYNRHVAPRWRIARHMQYEDYLIHEVVPLVRLEEPRPASGRARMQLWRLPRGQHRSAPSRHLYRPAVDVRRIRSVELSWAAITTRTATTTCPRTTCPTSPIPGSSSATAATPTCWPPAGTTNVWPTIRNWIGS